MVTEEQVMAILAMGWDRFMDMVLVPVEDPEMLWSVAPLVIAVLFMTFYFGRYKEELGWNTAFGNTMVFLFVAISLIKEMYYDAGITSLDGLLASPSYLVMSGALAGASFLLMLITYFRKIPDRLAFFLFSAPPINVSIYVIMTIIYAGVPADGITALAALILLVMILLLTNLLKIIIYAIAGYHEELKSTIASMGLPVGGGKKKETAEKKELPKEEPPPAPTKGKK